MRISLTRDIKAPPARIFEALTDFDALERRIRQGGAEIARRDDGGGGRADARWTIGLDLRGHRREIDARVARLAPDDHLSFAAVMDGIAATVDTDVAETAPGTARLVLTADLRGTTMSGKLLVQSLKVARASLTDRIGKRLDALVGMIESDHAARNV